MYCEAWKPDEKETPWWVFGKGFKFLPYVEWVCLFEGNVKKFSAVKKKRKDITPYTILFYYQVTIIFKYVREHNA